MSFKQIVELSWAFFVNKPPGTVPDGPFPVVRMQRSELEKAPDGSLYRLGHSTVLIKLNGQFLLTDPVFSKRASPVQWAGPARFHEVPIDIDELPPIAGVILSHNHYDHLDHAAIRALDARTGKFFAPLGVGDQLVRWGIAADKVEQLDWWQSTRIAGIELVATPAQHFSGRGLNDGNRSLWASWVIKAQDVRIFFSGDTGYFDGFKTIGEKHGPFDLTLMETGAYDERWAYVHMQPEQTVQAHIDLRGRWMLPIHNGTFDLALHPWQQPFERVEALARKHDVALTTPLMGQRIDVLNPTPGARWWQQGEVARSMPSLSPESLKP